MKVLVTGGAGFIGSHLVEELVEDGHDVTILDNLATGTLDNLHHINNYVFYKEDVRDFDAVRKHMEGKDVVFHLAALPRITPSLADPLLPHNVNLTGTLNVLEAASKTGTFVVFSGSSSVFGKTSVIPMREDDPKNPGSPYALQKLMCESYIQLYRRLYGLKCAVLRFFNVYGARQPQTGAYAVVAGIFQAQKAQGLPLTIKGDGTQRRDFTYVGDVVSALITVGEQKLEGTYHIGSGKNHSVNELADAIDPGGEREYLPLSAGDYPVTLADLTKSQNAFGYKPSVDILDWLASCQKTEESIPLSTGKA